MADLDDCKIVLTNGKFVDARGFLLGEDHIVARFEDPDEVEQAENPWEHRLMLAWTAPEAPQW